MHVLIRKVRCAIWSLLIRLVCGNKIDARKIVFNQTDGNGFGCNQKYIALELLKRHPDWDFVWLVRDPAAVRKEIPPQIRLVPYFSFAAMKELSTAKIWCSNQFFRHHVKHCGLTKKPGQFYVQTWHCSLGIKVVHSGASWEKICPKSSGHEFKRREGAMIDYVIANSDWDAERQLDHFYGHGCVKMFGHPRNDIFFSEQARLAARKKVYDACGLELTQKTILYVPTLRVDKNWKGYFRDWQTVIPALERKFGGKWSVLARIHPVLLHKGIAMDGGADAIDVSSYPDIQELLAAADAMVTDYSSCMFDFMLQKKPCFAYVPDLAEYEKEQGLMYPITDTPFPVAKSQQEFAGAIEAFDAGEYLRRCDDFLVGKGCIEDGKASVRTVDLIEQLVLEKD